MQTLILLSFTQTLDAVASALLHKEDLANALFFFGCTRTYLFDQSDEEIIFSQSDRQKFKVLPAHVSLVRKAVDQGEKDGRAFWWRDAPLASQLSGLNKVLAKAWIEPIPRMPNPLNGANLQLAIHGANRDLVRERKVWFLSL